ncbi:MAG: hypothetical protein GC199_11135 [Alphaproteobacteria bacterium]|nr:hypothetical protein [Alphaproteobacteria bacterium]
MSQFKRVRGALAGLLIAFSAGVSAAEAGSGVAGSPAISGVPRGTYLQTCRDAYVQGELFRDALLIADCRTRNNRWIRSTLEYKACRSDIYNRDGFLACETYQDSRQEDYVGQWGDRRGDGRGYLPGGSWQQTCRDAYFDGDVLYARCQDRRGRLRETSLDLDRCGYASVYNDDGRLTCSGDDHRGSARIVLFERDNGRGQRIEIRDSYNDLKNAFNDRAQSVRVDGGVWQLCRDKKYKGGCIVVDRSTNLYGDYRNTISSVRRLQ